MRNVAQLWGTPDDSQWPQALEIRQQFIERWSELINAQPGTLTTAENVTTALYSLIGSLPARYLDGRRVLVAADCFPSLHFLLAGMAEQHGFDARHGADARRRKLGARRGLHRALDRGRRRRADHAGDLHRIVSLRSPSAGRARPRDRRLIGVDMTQGIGLIPYDVQAPEVGLHRLDQPQVAERHGGRRASCRSVRRC